MVMFRFVSYGAKLNVEQDVSVNVLSPAHFVECKSKLRTLIKADGKDVIYRETSPFEVAFVPAGCEWKQSALFKGFIAFAAKPLSF